jgi:hypothetical protein
METYLKMMASWNKKTLEQKAELIGEDALDKWVEKILRDAFLVEETPAPVSAISVINSLPK